MVSYAVLKVKTSQMKLNADISWPTAFLCKVDHGACGLLDLTSDSDSWHFHHLLLNSGECCETVSGYSVLRPPSASVTIDVQFCEPLCVGFEEN